MNRYIKAFSIALLFVLLSCGISHATDTGQEIVNKIDENSAYQFNDEIRKLRTELDKANATIATAVPTGCICMWHGSIATIPTGYALCDGNNGTPDLRDKFIVGAGNTYAVAATGGKSTHTLTVSELPTSVWYSPGGGGSSAIPNAGATTAFTCGGGAHENKPPYYALAYIMKL